MWSYLRIGAEVVVYKVTAPVQLQYFTLGMQCSMMPVELPDPYVQNLYQVHTSSPATQTQVVMQVVVVIGN